jgi:hypothetical protein
MPEVIGIQKIVEQEIKVSVNERKIEKSRNIDFGYIEKDGSIIVVNRISELIIVARPSIENNIISWKCHVYPGKFNRLSLISDCGSLLR